MTAARAPPAGPAHTGRRSEIVDSFGTDEIQRIVEQYSPSLLRLAASRLSPADAEDAVQEAFLRLLTDDEAVISASSAYFPWALVIPLCSMAAFVWDGIFIGVTATRGMLVSLAVSASVFFVTFFCLSPWLGNHALWLAMTLYLAVRGMVQTVLYRRDIAGKI